jgi:hypothetical protein
MTNQYFIYGTIISLKKFNTIGEINDDVHGIFTGKIGKFLILGKILDSDSCFGQNKPFKVPKLDEVDELIIKQQIKNKFDVEGIFNYYFITK